MRLCSREDPRSKKLQGVERRMKSKDRRMKKEEGGKELNIRHQCNRSENDYSLILLIYSCIVTVHY